MTEFGVIFVLYCILKIKDSIKLGNLEQHEVNYELKKSQK